MTADPRMKVSIDSDGIITVKGISQTGFIPTIYHAPGKHNFTLGEGRRFTRKIICQNMDGTAQDMRGFYAIMQIRRTHGSEILFQWNSAAGGYIDMGTVNGEYVIDVPADVLETINWDLAEYDLKIIPPNTYTSNTPQDIDIDVVDAANDDNTTFEYKGAGADPFSTWLTGDLVYIYEFENVDNIDWVYTVDSITTKKCMLTESIAGSDNADDDTVTFIHFDDTGYTHAFSILRGFIRVLREVTD